MRGVCTIDLIKLRASVYLFTLISHVPQYLVRQLHSPLPTRKKGRESKEGGKKREREGKRKEGKNRGSREEGRRETGEALLPAGHEHA